MKLFWKWLKSMTVDMTKFVLIFALLLAIATGLILLTAFFVGIEWASLVLSSTLLFLMFVFYGYSRWKEIKNQG